jgi:hypothetical protein
MLKNIGGVYTRQTKKERVEVFRHGDCSLDETTRRYIESTLDMFLRSETDLTNKLKFWSEDRQTNAYAFCR